MNKIRIWLDDNGIANILRYNDRLEALERETMERKLSEIKAEFLQTFGFEGVFEIKAVQTRPGKTHGRLTYRISAASSRTASALKSNPGWLAQFIR